MTEETANCHAQATTNTQVTQLQTVAFPQEDFANKATHSPCSPNPYSGGVGKQNSCRFGRVLVGRMSVPAGFVSVATRVLSPPARSEFPRVVADHGIDEPLRASLQSQTRRHTTENDSRRPDEQSRP